MKNFFKLLKIFPGLCFDTDRFFLNLRCLAANGSLSDEFELEESDELEDEFDELEEDDEFRYR